MPTEKAFTSRRLSRPVTIAVVAAVVVLAAAGFVVPWPTPDVIAVPQSLICNGKPAKLELLPANGFEGVEEFPVPTFKISAGPGTHCNLRLVAVNSGSRKANLDSVEFSRMIPGPMIGDLMMATRYLEGDLAPTDIAEIGDALFEIDEELPAGESRTMQFHLEYRPGQSSCHDRGYSEHHIGLPLIRSSAWGWHNTTDAGVNLLIRGVGDGTDADGNCG